MRVLLVGDIHLSDRPPSVRRETYADEIMAKLEQTVSLASHHEADAVVWAGDVFHIKTPSRTSHRLVQMTAEVGQSYHCPWLVVPGNHDMQHDRLESLPEQPLGVLFKAGAVPLMGRPDESLPIHGIPFLNRWDRDLPRWMEGWRDDDATLMVTHAPIIPPEQTLPYEVIRAEAWAEAMRRPGHVYYGHMHNCDGSYEVGFHALDEGDGDVFETFWFCNQGALSRGSLHEETLARLPAVTLYDSQVGGDPFTRIEVDHLPASSAFRLAEHEEGVARQEKLDTFLESIGQTKLVQLSAEAVIHDLQKKGLSESTMREVKECIEHAVTS